MVEKNYPDRPNQVTLETGAALAIKKMNQAGYKVIIISNQSGIARGYFDEVQVAQVNHRLETLLAYQGARLERFFHCPHHPQGVVEEYTRNCSCRKPQPGMIIKAAKELGIDLTSSFMVGDRRTDLQAGIRAGCRPILVRTGYGKVTEEKLKQMGIVIPGLLVFDNLLDMTDALIGQGSGYRG